jgi:heavy metal translocating P-type ATPase
MNAALAGRLLLLRGPPGAWGGGRYKCMLLRGGAGAGARVSSQRLNGAAGATVVAIRHHGNHDHSHHALDASSPPASGGDNGAGMENLAERFAKGETLWSILLKRREGRMRLYGVAAGTALCWCDCSSLLGLNSTLLPFEPIGFLTTAAGAFPTLQSAIGDLSRRKVSLDLSMSIGLLAALFSGETFTSSLMTLVVLVSNELEEVTVAKTEGNISKMSAKLPENVEVLVDGHTKKSHISSVHVGDVLRVRPGGLLPVDGRIVQGSASIDESGITGEPLPRLKLEGDKVFAGTINQDGVVDVEVAAIGETTIVGRIITTVREAETQQAPIVHLADRAAKAVVYFALASSTITYAVTGLVDNAVSVLVVAGACGIALGTPLAIVGGIGSAARQGVIIKGGRHLEALTQVDAIVFDKTGTLTTGQPRVSDWYVIPSATSEDYQGHFADVLHEVGGRSEHPLARALVHHAGPRQATVHVDDYQVKPGLGVACTIDGKRMLVGSLRLMEVENVNVESLQTSLPQDWGWLFHPDHGESTASEVLVVEDGKLLGVLLVKDTLREEAPAVIEQLRQQGLKMYIMSGDRKRAVLSIAQQLGISASDVHAELSPAAKQSLVEDMVRRGEKVVMVGDGLNDAMLVP